MVAAAARSGMGLRERGGIAVYMKMHVAGMISEYGVRMCRTVVEEVDDGSGGGVGARGLGGGKGA